MNELFLKIINMSISASWLVLAVLLLRLLFKKAPKWVNVLLWGIVAVRLVCPFSFESALSLIPSAETIPLNIGMDTTPTINSGINALNNAVNPIISQSNTPMAGASINPLQITIGIYEYIWIFGMIALALYTAISYWRLRRKVDTAVCYKDNIFQSENVSSPFVLGIIKPRIYLPFNMDARDLEHVVSHEQAHIRRKDHWWKPLGFLLLTIHWFNPLMWLAYVLLCRDIELACDEKVIKELGNEQRADYTQALVACSVNRRMIAACPLAFGEVGVKERVKSVMNYKKPAFWVIVLAVIACVVVAACFLTNPSNDEQYAPEPFGHVYKVEEILFDAPQYSFVYSIDTAPRYQFTSDYAMFVSENALSQDGSMEWAQQTGGFEEVKITTENFDNYFDMPGFQISNDRWSKFRSSIKKAWRIDIENDENNVFYYLISTESGEVYLTYGYHDPEGETDPHLDDSSIRWLFKLARTDLLTCNAISEGINAFVELVCFPDKIDRDTDNWPVAQINESGTLQFSLEGDANTLVVSEDYYRKSEDSTFIERNSFEVGQNDDGFFTIDIARRESLEDHVNYFIKIKGQSDVYAMKVVFTDEGASPQMQFAGELIPGTTYVSYQCLYMNPLSSYAAMGGDSGCKYIVGEDYFATIHRNDGSFVSVTNPNLDMATSGLDGLQNMIDVSSWEWQEFPYTDEEWAALYVPQGFGGISNISEIYDEMLYQPLTAGKFLLKMDNSLWLVELAANQQMGTYLWSIYSLVPESAMGVAQWEYAPMLSSRCPLFRFEFDMDYTEISAVCTDSLLMDWETPGATADHSMTFKKGVPLCWSPLDENGNVVASAIIYFSVHQNDIIPYSGTIYIEGNSGSDGRRIYNATIVGTGLHLEPHSEISGGVISAIASPNVIRVVEHDLTTGDLEVPVEDLGNYVFYTNSKQISVTVKGGDFDGQVNLLDVSQDNAHIMQHKVNTRNDDCLFTGLTSARLYRVDCEGLGNCTVVISGDK